MRDSIRLLPAALLILSALALGVASAPQAAPKGFAEHKLPGLSIDLPSNWNILPTETLAQIQKKAGNATILLAASTPDAGVPQFVIMEQPSPQAMEQAAFEKLDAAGVNELCAAVKTNLEKQGATDIRCGREKTAEGSALAATAAMPAAGRRPALRTVAWTFYQGKKAVAAAAMILTDAADKALPQVESALKSVRLGK